VRLSPLVFVVMCRLDSGDILVEDGDDDGGGLDGEEAW
jgi:hypothetical protein